MIANVSPCSLSYEDTLNTLKYANRAKDIKTKVNIIFISNFRSDRGRRSSISGCPLKSFLRKNGENTCNGCSGQLRCS